MAQSVWDHFWERLCVSDEAMKGLVSACLRDLLSLFLSVLLGIPNLKS